MDAAAAATPGWAGSPLRSGGSPAPSYAQLALYLAGNALTIVIGLLLWNLNTVRRLGGGWPGHGLGVMRCTPPACHPSTLHHPPPPQVLADFRDSMLYALLCSIALRPAKEALVQRLDRSLADARRPIGAALLALAALPLTALRDAYDEARAVLAKWRQAVAEEFARRQAQLKQRGEPAAGGAGGAAAPTSPRTPRTVAASAAATATKSALHTMPSLAVYGHAAVRVLKSRWGGWRAELRCRLSCLLLRHSEHAAAARAGKGLGAHCWPAAVGPPPAGAPARSGGSSGS